MMRTKRTAVILIFLGLLIPSFNQAARSQSPAVAADARKTFTIAGTVGLPGVVMRGLPGDPITDSNGAYSVEVPKSFVGSVKPTKPGYTFEPESRIYQVIDRDYKTEDYVSCVFMFRIWGSVGVGGVMMKGLPGDSVTDAVGGYRVEVPYGWSGKVIPSKEGYEFTPPFRVYSSLTSPCPGQDYIAKIRTVIISDRIKAGNEPIADVKVTAEPGGQSVITDLQGRYAIQVPYGWTGRLIFSKQDFAFAPDSKPFTNVTRDIGLPSARPEYPRVIAPATPGHVFVIPTAQVVPQKLAETADDLRVMLQILRDKLSEPRMVRGAFVDFGDFFGDRDRALEAFYLQGSAAVFVLEMDSPFSFASPPPGEGEAAKETVDPVWQRARQKLYTPPDPTMRGSRGAPGDTGQMDFQQFKEDLLKTLRHAANLRNVEPNESVILTIIAHGESGAWPAPASAGGSYSAGGGAWFEGSSYSAASSSFGPAGGTTHADSGTRSSGSIAGRPVLRGTGSNPAPGAANTVLTIQAKKADIDAFAKGDLSFEQFQQRVKTFTF